MKDKRIINIEDISTKKYTSYTNCVFINLDIEDLVFYNIKFSKCSFVNCKLDNTDFVNCIFYNCNFISNEAVNGFKRY